MTALLLAVLALLGLPWLSAAGKAIRWVELTLIGCNDDWASKASNLAELLAHGPDIIFIQEGKAADYRTLVDDRPDSKTRGQKLLPRHLYAVHQDTSSPDRAGSVIIWRHAPLTGTAQGFTFGVKANGILTRWIAWVRTVTVIARVRLFLFSAHRPPVRTRHWWKPFDLALWARLKVALAAGRLVLGEMDSNEHGGPPSIPKSLRWVGKPGAIDGFVISRRVEIVSGPTPLPMGSSDHHPYELVVHIPSTRKKAA